MSQSLAAGPPVVTRHSCLQKQGIKPLIICKGLVGKSGASLFAGNLVISGRLLGNTDEQARNTAEFLIKYHNQFLIDQHWARRCGEWIERVYYPELEEAGLYFRRDDDGNVVTSPGKIRSVAANVQGNSGVPFMDLRRKQVIRAGIPRLEETVATALLRNADGDIGGVFCLNLMTGEYIIVQARAVVLATGYSDRLHTRSTGTREMSADGIAMAWRAGATLVNMEMQWWHTNDIADPPSWQRMQVYPNPMLGSEKSARMVNSDGEEFFNQQQDDPLAFGPYTVQLKALAKQVHAGKARYDGGYYAGFDHCDPAEVEAYTTYGKTYRQLGLRLSRTTGRNRRHIALPAGRHRRRYRDDALVGAGTLCRRRRRWPQQRADRACDLRRQGRRRRHCRRTLHGSSPHRYAPKRGRGGKPTARRLARCVRPAVRRPSQVKEKLRKLMWDKVGVEKDAAGMRSALEDIEQIRLECCPTCASPISTRIANYEWLDAIDVVNMIDACELIVHSSLERKESRGPFFRHGFSRNRQHATGSPPTSSRSRVMASRSSSALMICRSSSPVLQPKTIFEVAW